MPRVSKKGRGGRPATFSVGSQVRVRALRGPDAEGRWYWQATGYDPTTRKRPTLWSGWASAARAEREVVALLHSGQGALPAPAPDGEAIKTVADLLEHWYATQEQRSDLRPASVRIYRYAARHIVGSSIARRPVRRLRRADLERYRDLRLSQGAATLTVSKELRVLRAAWSWFLDLTGRPNLTLPKVTLKVTRARPRVTPTRPQILAVLAELDGWARTAMVLLYATGARPGEIRDLRWGALDLRARTVSLDGKTGPRTVPLSADAVREVAQVRPQGVGPEAPVLSCTRSTFDSAFGPHVLRKACADAGVPRFTPYGLRRAAVDTMARAGVDIGTAAAITGHSPEVMLRHYRGVTEDDKRRAAEVACLGEIPEGRVVAFRGRGRAKRSP